MSVYTNLTKRNLKEILKRYHIGNVRTFSGISDGITNSNFYLNTTQGEYVLTIFEDINENKAKRYLELMSFFSNNNLCSPMIQRTSSDNFISIYKGKPLAIMQKLEGETVKKSNIKLCKSLGCTIAQFHKTSLDYNKSIKNSRDIKWIDKSIKRVKSHLSTNQVELLIEAKAIYKRFFNYKLPTGIIHSDLFKDNVLHKNNKVLGIIDYYYSFTGPFIYELAVIINDWCVKPDGTIDSIKYHNLIEGYNSIKSLTTKENKYIKEALIAAALRFYLSRLLDMIFPKVGEITHIKDPLIFEKILLHRFSSLKQ